MAHYPLNGNRAYVFNEEQNITSQAVSHLSQIGRIHSHIGYLQLNIRVGEYLSMENHFGQLITELLLDWFCMTSIKLN